MSTSTDKQDVENAWITLGLLKSLERESGRSQRSIASDMGVAVGLVNAYIRRCVRKGLVKVSEAPARRYAYYLTPQGFAEKSRLTIEYLAHSFSFFRQARADCSEALSTARKQGWSRIALAGASDLAEIARLCALDEGIEISVVVDAKASGATFIGLPVVASFAGLNGSVDAIMVTDLRAARAAYDEAAVHFSVDRIFAPSLLGLAINAAQEHTP